MKLPTFNLVATEMSQISGAFYLLDQFEVDLEGGVKLYGKGTLRIQPKVDASNMRSVPMAGFTWMPRIRRRSD